MTNQDKLNLATEFGQKYEAMLACLLDFMPSTATYEEVKAYYMSVSLEERYQKFLLTHDQGASLSVETDTSDWMKFMKDLWNLE